MDLKNEIVKSLKASVRNDILDQDKRQIANNLTFGDSNLSLK